ncbi:MAG TPA: hypothetical protein VNG91_05675 [Terriglobia bacterium]|nr:hypothetical protein [Terriglobia bacterium]
MFLARIDQCPQPPATAPAFLDLRLLMTTGTPTSVQGRAETTSLPIGYWQSPLASVLKKCFSFPVLLGALLLGVNFEIVRTLSLDPDTWWHIKYGETILKTGQWPMVDTWSFTAHGMPRMAYEWGGEVVTALAWRLDGLRGLDVLLIVLTSMIVLLLYYFAWLRCRSSKAAFLGACLMLPVAAMCFTLRPQLLGYIFLLITMISLERFRQGQQKTLWVLPPLFLAWVNTHGSFTLGFMVLGLYWLSGLADFSFGGLHAVRWRPAQRLHMEIVCLLSVLVLPITPYGTRLAAVPLEVATSLPLNFSSITEWQPLSMSSGGGKLVLILLFAFIVAQITFRLSYRLEELALFFIVAYLTFIHLRFAVLYAIVFAPLAASILARWVPAYDPMIDKYVLNAALILAVCSALVWYLPSQAALHKTIAKGYPVQAVRYLRYHPLPGRMFNAYGFGGYLVWAMAPEHKVFIDGRGDVYEQAGVFSDYLDVMSIRPDALAILQSYRINSCLVERDSALAALLGTIPGWKRIYEDKLSAIFVRTALPRPKADAAEGVSNHAR